MCQLHACLHAESAWLDALDCMWLAPVSLSLPTGEGQRCEGCSGPCKLCLTVWTVMLRHDLLHGAFSGAMPVWQRLMALLELVHPSLHQLLS